jgi:hypothetical protein
MRYLSQSVVAGGAIFPNTPGSCTRLQDGPDLKKHYSRAPAPLTSFVTACSSFGLVCAGNGQKPVGHVGPIEGAPARVAILAILIASVRKHLQNNSLGCESRWPNQGGHGHRRYDGVFFSLLTFPCPLSYVLMEAGCSGVGFRPVKRTSGGGPVPASSKDERSWMEGVCPMKKLKSSPSSRGWFPKIRSRLILRTHLRGRELF